MKGTTYSRFTPAIISLMVAGCASYAPSLARLDPSGPNVTKTTKGDLTVFVDEHATADKSQRAFDTNLSRQGVLALLIRVENNGTQPHEVKSMEIVVRGDKALKPLTSEEAAGRAERNPVMRALGWSLIVPIISIPAAVAASAIHTSRVNEQIVRDFQAKVFQDGVILPGRERSGFLFFELDEGRKDLTGLTLELKAINTATGEPTAVLTSLPHALLETTDGSPDAREESR